MKSVLVDVIASSLVSRLLERPVKFRELQFCELTVNEGASTAPVTVEYSASITDRPKLGACPHPALVAVAVGGGVGEVGGDGGVGAAAAAQLFCIASISEIFNKKL
jgi:hypothetical protein